jgi:hypothetical protein
MHCLPSSAFESGLDCTNVLFFVKNAFVASADLPLCRSGHHGGMEGFIGNEWTAPFLFPAPYPQR